eukprot:scaffold10728_cov308-Chaetoceros_neogracile.AAC.2
MNCRSFSTQSKPKPKVSFLNLQGSGMSAIERLCLEEALLSHDPLKRSWAIVGTHEPRYNSYLPNPEFNTSNESCLIIMGVGAGGKPDSLLDIEKVKRDGVLAVKRFSGGGAIVVDDSTLWTTFIGRNDDFPHVDPHSESIMAWSANDVFHKVFANMKADALHHNIISSEKKNMVMDTTKSCQAALDNETSGKHPTEDNSTLQTTEMPDFALRENDYVIGERKVGDNAQLIVDGAWLHHTTFLWDYEEENMSYLTLPSKRPEYRGERDHDDFLVKLRSTYALGDDNSSKRAFFYHVKCAAFEAFELEEVLLKDAMKVVDDLGGMKAWFEGGCRTKILDL